jgi:hypothetical protein
VEATNAETGAVYSGSSISAGKYAIPNLPVGTYALASRGVATIILPNETEAALRGGDHTEG